ncbi:MAG: hypothetical protein FWC76_02085 [Defluviitaleaceae bacterium]|nr:hypothetical protein [Defluviitaleaceae bacterium]
MNTERVKNVLIVLLSVIAISLASLIFVTEEGHTLSAAQEEAIIAILERDDVHFTGEMMRDFRPVRQMEMHRYDYDIESLAGRFFGDEKFSDDEDYPERIFMAEDGSKIMAYSSWTNVVTFIMGDGISNAAFNAAPSAATAGLLAMEYIEGLMGMPSDMQAFPTVVGERGNWVVNFFTTYRGHVLHNDHIRVNVTENGITNIMYSRVYFNGFVGENRNIFPPNEALMALVNHMRRAEQVTGRIFIDDMRLSYLLMEEGEQSVGIPVYVFSVHLGGDLRWDYIFNAYTNEFIRDERSL